MCMVEPSPLEVNQLFPFQCGDSCQAMAWAATDHLQATMPTPTSSTIHITTLVNGKVVASTKSAAASTITKEVKEEVVVNSVVVIGGEGSSRKEERRDQGVVGEEGEEGEK